MNKIQWRQSVNDAAGNRLDEYGLDYKMNSDAESQAFSWGVIVGMIMILLGTFVSWHIMESDCQELYDVHDCVMLEQPFVPYVQPDE